ncbi:hypothetical protein TH25_16580 [Thalassospira profundimaris]|uniref:Uncharacterized protein n=1 Tax=Thalassospira profundimaris TaxID=502049 RepID=A0A367X1C3_9PROT|nr:hypothetical protein TH25_16580 [Thalassospira profundimaris]
MRGNILINTANVQRRSIKLMAEQIGQNEETTRQTKMVLAQYGFRQTPQSNPTAKQRTPYIKG